MAKQKTVSANRFEGLNKFLRKNKKIDFKTANLLSTKTLEALNWTGIEEEDRPDVLKQVKAYQRLVRILSEDNPRIIKALLKENIHSAIQIAALPRQQFMKEYLKAFRGDKELMKDAYRRATAIRSQVLLKYMNTLQNAQPHARAVRSMNVKK